MTLARDERLALCALLDQTGPHAPTLCEGWATRDLAAHLVLREHRPDAGAGVMGGPLAGYTRRVQRSLSERTPYPRLVETIRNGPPRLSLFGIPGMDERANFVEYFVHHEDVRRGAPGWEPRALSPELAEALWQRLGLARFMLRKAPVGIELVRDDLPADAGAQRVRITAKASTPVVTVTGSPAELTMWAMGRTSAAQVKLEGNETAIGKLAAPAWRPGSAG
jgi:uncharacterized protein (TIGR03085 family)